MEVKYLDEFNKGSQSAPSFFDPTRRTTAGGQVIDIATGKVLQEAPSKTITPKSMESARALNIPSGVIDYGTAESAVASASQGAKAFQDYYKEFLGAETETQKRQREI